MDPMPPFVRSMFPPQLSESTEVQVCTTCPPELMNWIEYNDGGTGSLAVATTGAEVAPAGMTGVGAVNVSAHALRAIAKAPVFAQLESGIALFTTSAVNDSD